MIRNFFILDNDGRGAAIAVVLFLAVIPVMFWNIRRFRGAGGLPMTLTAPCPPMSRQAAPPPSGAGADVRKGGWFVRITIIVVVALWLVPTLGVLVTSFRPEAVVNTSGWWTIFAHLFDSSQWTFENYRQTLDAQGFENAFLNSLAVTIPATVIPITIAAFAAYAFSWMEFRGRYVMFVAVVGLLVVPLQMALIPILRLFVDGAQPRRDDGLSGPRPERHVPRRVAGSHRLRAAARRLPVAQLHRRAALVDHRVGQDRRCRPLHDLLAAVVPLSVPALAAFAIFQFLWVWNDLLVAYVFLGRNQPEPGAHDRPAEPGRLRGEDWHLLTSAAFITMILPLIVFFSLQRYFVRGLTAGAVKGVTG